MLRKRCICTDEMKLQAIKKIRDADSSVFFHWGMLRLNRPAGEVLHFFFLAHSWKWKKLQRGKEPRRCGRATSPRRASIARTASLRLPPAPSSSRSPCSRSPTPSAEVSFSSNLFLQTRTQWHFQGRQRYNATQQSSACFYICLCSWRYCNVANSQVWWHCFLKKINSDFASFHLFIYLFISMLGSYF